MFGIDKSIDIALLIFHLLAPILADVIRKDTWQWAELVPADIRDALVEGLLSVNMPDDHKKKMIDKLKVEVAKLQTE